MINLYIAPNGFGKTKKLLEKYMSLVNKKTFTDKNAESISLFFPSGSEIISIIKGEKNKGNEDNYGNNLAKLVNKYLKENILGEEQTKSNLSSLRRSIKNWQTNFVPSDLQNECNNNKQYYDFLKKIYNEIKFDIDEAFKFEIPFKNDGDIKTLGIEDGGVTTSTSSKLSFSTGQLTLFHIKECFRILKKFYASKKVNLFFDEPESYLHPKYIDDLVKEINSLLSQVSNCNFFISTHNAQFISSLINGNMHEITINYRLENDAREKDKNDEWFTQIKCNTSEIKNHYISSNQILYEVYHVANIEFLDELIAKILEKDESGNNIINSVTYFGKENKDRASYEAQGLKCLNPAHECDGYRHMTIICFARNYFHHPNCRDLVQTGISYNKYLKQNGLKIDKLLIESIENAIQLLNQHHKYCKLL